jgi:hypothetical protein
MKINHDEYEKLPDSGKVIQTDFCKYINDMHVKMMTLEGINSEYYKKQYEESKQMEDNYRKSLSDFTKEGNHNAGQKDNIEVKKKENILDKILNKLKIFLRFK